MAVARSSYPVTEDCILEHRPISLACTPESLRAEADLVAGGSLRLLREQMRQAQERHGINHSLQSHLYVCLPVIDRLIRVADAR